MLAVAKHALHARFVLGLQQRPACAEPSAACAGQSARHADPGAQCAPRRL